MSRSFRAALELDPTLPFHVPAVDWEEYASYLAELEAAQGELALPTPDQIDDADIPF